MKRYRLIEYDGDESRIDETFARSLHGTYPTAQLRITGVEVKAGGITFEQKRKLKDASETISGWPGQHSASK